VWDKHINTKQNNRSMKLTKNAAINHIKAADASATLLSIEDKDLSKTIKELHKEIETKLNKQKEVTVIVS